MPLGSAAPPPLPEDMAHILEQTAGLAGDLKDMRLFVTGGTGFFGKWLLESFAFLRQNIDLGDAVVTVLTRDPQTFLDRMPHLAECDAIHFLTGDVRDFAFPEGRFDYIVHAATDASARLNMEEPLRMLDVVVGGTRRVLEFARHCRARRFLLTSSGAVYGRSPVGITHLEENYSGGPDLMGLAVAYAEGKRLAEALTAIYARQYQFDAVITRTFAVVGPHLPLDMHFAIGNFIRDGMAGGPIVVGGDGTPRRSFLYGADLAIWLWTLLFRGASLRPYNVGSAEAVSIAELAQAVATCFEPKITVDVKKTPPPGQTPEWYVPSVERVHSELGLRPWIDLRESILRTIAWYGMPQAAKA